MPVQQTMTFDPVINRRTANALGLPAPTTLFALGNDRIALISALGGSEEAN